VADLSGGFTTASSRPRADYAAAWFAETLRHSPHAAEVPTDQLAQLAEDAYHASNDSKVRELADLIRRS